MQPSILTNRFLLNLRSTDEQEAREYTSDKDRSASFSQPHLQPAHSATFDLGGVGEDIG